MAKRVNIRTFTTDGEAINKAVDLVHKRVSSVMQDIHCVAVNAGCHLVEHGQVALINKLCDGLGDGVRGNALRDWFVVKFPVVWDAEAKAFGVNKEQCKVERETMQADVDAYVKDKRAVTFMQLVPQPEYKGFNLDVEINKLVDRATRIARDEKKAASDLTNVEHLSDFTSFAKSLTKAGEAQA